MIENRAVGDMEGAWVDPDFESGLIARCRQNWSTPVGAVSNQILATFVRQRIGIAIVVPEAQRRIAAGFTDDSELYDGELLKALQDFLRSG